MEEKTRSNKDGRVPPQDIEAEKSLLGALMISSDALPEILTIIKPNDFYEKRHEIIFQAMANLYDKNQPIDLLTLTSELKSQKKLKEVGGAVYLTELSNFVPAASHVKAYADIVEKTSIRRKLIKAGSKIANKAYEDDANADELIGEAERELFEVSDKVIKSDYVPISKLLPGAFDKIENLHKNKGALRGLKTGFHDLDKITAGFQKGDLVVLGARPSMGKTMFGQNLAYNIASINKKGVLFFSMEMSADEIIERIISDIADVNNWNIRTGNLSEAEFSRVGDALAEMDEIPIYIDDTGSMNIIELRNKVRRAMHDHDNNIGVVIVDYLQLISGTGAYKGNRVQEVTEVSQGLKILARELNIPVIALAQLSRNVTGREDRRPVLSDLRESGSIEQDADLVMLLHREDYYKKNDEEKDHEAEIIVAKHRHGATGTIKLYFDGAKMRFMSLDETRE